jgi:hypothetical protein
MASINSVGRLISCNFWIDEVYIKIWNFSKNFFPPKKKYKYPRIANHQSPMNFYKTCQEYSNNAMSAFFIYASYYVFNLEQPNTFTCRLIQSLMVVNFSSMASVFSRPVSQKNVLGVFFTSLVGFYSVMTVVLYHPDFVDVKSDARFQLFTKLYTESIHGLLYYTWFLVAKQNANRIGFVYRLNSVNTLKKDVVKEEELSQE